MSEPTAVHFAPHRVAALDGLRLLAAIGVLAKHWVGVGGAGVTEEGDWVFPWGSESTAQLFGPLQAVAVYGWVGVQLFFLISGFVICMSAWGRSLDDFVTARVARLLPAYWFAIVLTVAVVRIRPGLTGGESPGGIGGALLNLTMMQAAYQVPSVDPSYWTLWNELIFYLLFAVVVRWGLTYRRVVAFAGLWTVAAMIAAASGNAVLKLIFMPQYSPYFIAGIAFYLIFRYGHSLLVWGIVGLQYLLALHTVRQDIGGQIAESDRNGHTVLVVSIVITCCFVVMALVAVRALDGIRWRWLHVAGALTYPLYLMHQVIGFVLIWELRAYLPPTAVLVVALVTMLALAWLVQRFVEPPARRRLRSGLTASFAAVHRRSDARSRSA